MDSSLSTLNEIDDIEIAHSIQCDIEDLTKNIVFKGNDLTIVSQNIRSIYANIDDLNANLSVLNVDPDVLILTECRLNPHKTIPCLKNYTSYATTRQLNQNDGVVAYLKNGNTPTNVKEVSLDHASCLQIDMNNLTILGVYRSPCNTNTETFINSLNLHLESLNANRDIILTGDININLIARETELAHDRNNRLNYLNMLAMHSIMPGHAFPTRENNCLDHYMIKLDKDKACAQIAVLNTTVTDHLMIFLNISYQNSTVKCKKTKTVTNFENALVSLAAKNLPELLLCDDPDKVIEQMIHKITESIKENTISVHVPSSKRTIKPWITSGILRCIRNRNKLQKNLRLDPYNEILKISYKRYRNYCNNLIKKLKRNYERKQLEKSSGNSKHLWKNIKTITHLNRSKSDCSNLLQVKASPYESVNYVNDFFSSIGKKLAEDIAPNSNSLNQLDLENHNTQLNSFVLLDTDPEETHNVLMGLKSDSAPGWDNIPTSFLKLAKKEVVPIISHLANLCFSNGIFPSLLKQSIITPVFKNGDINDVNNYRPISVLPAISKIIEKLLNSRLIKYLNQYQLLSDAQYGFRNGRSTEDAVTALSSYIVDQVDRGRKCLGVYLDIKKAFDTVHVANLVNKLEDIGVRDKPLALFTDYLSDRKQMVKIGQYTSKYTNISYGVPQGSVLGPTLFLVYINNLCNLKVGDARIFSYADDTAVIFSSTSWSKARNEAEMGLTKINHWLRENLLTLNASKTNFMCYTIYSTTQPGNDFLLRIHNSENAHNDNDCNCPILNKVSSTKYLGVMMDQKLTWYSQIEVLSTRIRKLIWIFKILRHVAPPMLLNKIYSALAESILRYCAPVWGGAAKTKFIEVERAQRSLFKVMFFKSYRYSTDLLYSSCKLLTVRKIYILQIILRLHRTLIFDPKTLTRRRKDKAVKVHITKTSFANRQFAKQSGHLYNNINKTLDIYPKRHYECKSIVYGWLLTKSYEEIEALLQYVT